jgi:hypothetical protein
MGLTDVGMPLISDGAVWLAPDMLARGTSRYMLHAFKKNFTYYIFPELTFTYCPFSFRKGREAALIWHVREHWGRLGEHGSVEGATAEYGERLEPGPLEGQ